MSGSILTQNNTDISISLDNGATYQEFPCVTGADPGSASVPFTDTSCFSTPTNEPEFTPGRVTRSAGSVTYKLGSNTIHQYMLENPGATVSIRSAVQFQGGGSYTRTQDFLIGGTSEPIEFDGEYVATTELQPTGEVVRAYT